MFSAVVPVTRTSRRAPERGGDVLRAQLANRRDRVVAESVPDERHAQHGEVARRVHLQRRPAEARVAGEASLEPVDRAAHLRRGRGPSITIWAGSALAAGNERSSAR